MLSAGSGGKFQRRATASSDTARFDFDPNFIIAKYVHLHISHLGESLS
jgi:hypothetical protein